MQLTVGLLMLVCFSFAVQAAMEVPEPYPEPMRQPRGGFPLTSQTIQSWHVYVEDTRPEGEANYGILNPGDHEIGIMDNWWTAVSSGTQHTSIRSTDGLRVNSTPYNHASDSTTGADNYWLDTADRELHFYMTYSQMDNNTVAEYSNWTSGNPPTNDYGKYMAERHATTDGWALGWSINKYVNGLPMTKIGDYDMDIFVHNGKGVVLDGDEVYISDPQITSSNHISELAVDTQGNRLPTKWNESTMAYDAAANPQYMNYHGKSAQDIEDIGDSMEVHERNPYGTGPNVYGSYIDDRTPQWVLDNLVDDEGDPYTYDDAFTQRSDLFLCESIGGVIAGLAGYDEYNPERNNWGDQQVIRIDLGQDALEELDKIVLYDFGYYTGNPADPDGQVDPTEIVFYVDWIGGQFCIWYDEDGNGEYDEEVDLLLPDNRIYIAQVTINPIPEPTSLMTLGSLGLLGLLKRKKNRTTL
ncbi:MAG: hypothetical protein JXA11_07525 [Phycisphaerae bacterium]|nr:hypothetical protein [Phycisphaerae bacterium]